MTSTNKTWLVAIAAAIGSGALVYLATALLQGKPEPVPAASTFNAVTQSIAKAGVTRCLPRIDQVTNFISTQSQSGVFLFVAPQHADAALNSVSMEAQTVKGLSYASASFAPTGAQSCDAVYEAVVYWNNTCADVAAQGFAELKPAGVLREQIAILDGGKSLRVFLMPAGAGCVSVKKELIN